jgi:hypothetical protein
VTADELLIEFNHAMNLMPCACLGKYVKGKWTITEPCVGHRVMAKYDAYLLTQGN